MPQLINSKSECRNSKQILNSNSQMTKTYVLCFGFLSLGFVSDFVFRASDF